MGVDIVALHGLAALREGEAELACVFSDRRKTLPMGTVVMVTSRTPNDSIYRDLLADGQALEAAEIKSVAAIGDCLAPSTIAAAVYGGHKAARALDEPVPEGVPFRRELTAIDATN